MSCNCEDIIIEVSEEGIDGNGIANIELLSESGLTKTYRINFTNGSHFDYSISDGNGIASIAKTSTAGLVDTYTIYMTDGTTTYTFTVTNGKDGEPGVNTWGSIEGDINDQTDLKEALDLKADKADSYTKDELDGIFDGIDNALSTKADKTDVYTKTQADNLLAAKANTADLGALATMNAIDYTSDKLTNKPTLGALASKDTVNYETEVTNKPTLGTMAAEDASDYYDKDATDALLDEKADIIVTSASASLVHLTDAAPMPVKALSVAIDPVQDLHGYDNPWPAGGNSNIWDEELEQGSININTGSTFDSTTYSRSKNFIPIDPSKTYYIKASYQIIVYFYDTNKAYLGYVSASKNNTTVTPSSEPNAYDPNVAFTSAAYMKFRYSNDGASYNHDVAINYPSTVTTYSPYANVCPISGHSTAVVTRTGINIWDEEWELGSYNSSGAKSNSDTSIRCKNLIAVKPGTTYYMHLSGVNTNPWCYKEDGTFLKRFGSYLSTQTFTVPDDCYYITIALPATYGTTYNDDISINYPSTDTDYHAGHVQTVTIDLDGTRYGGTLDVLTGTLTVTDANIASYNGETLPSTWISSMDAYEEGATPTTGAQVVYKLASPQTVPLSANTLSLLLGENNLWSDTGDTSVTYRADTKLYIDGQILARDLAIKSIMTNVEAEMKATKNYTSGQVVIVGDSFYKLTSNVSSGSAFTVGTNCQKTDMATWILSIV